MGDALKSSERIRTSDFVPRVVMLDRDARRTLAASKTMAARGFVSSCHLSNEGFWLAVPKIRPTVLVLEVVPPLLSAARTVALARELLGRTPGVILYGWAPAAALSKLVEQMPHALVLARDEGPEALCAAVLTVHERAERDPHSSAIPEPPSSAGSDSR